MDSLYSKVLEIVNQAALAGTINERGVSVSVCDQLRAALTPPEQAVPGVFVMSAAKVDDAVLDTLNKQFDSWTMRAARGECSWICSDCCVTFPSGMPDACEHGHQGCTDIIKRDKACAAAERKVAT